MAHGHELLCRLVLAVAGVGAVVVHLPYGETYDVWIVPKVLKCVGEVLNLELFGRDARCLVVPAIDGAVACLGNHDRLVGIASAERCYYFVEAFVHFLSESGRLARVARDHAGIVVDGDEIRVLVADVVHSHVAGEGDQSAGIFGLHRGYQLVNQAFAFLCCASRLVQEGEDDYARVVEAVSHHVPSLLYLLLAELRVGKVPDALGIVLSVAPAEGLLPDKHSHLIAEFEEAVGLLVVCPTDEVASEVLEVLQVLHPLNLGHGSASKRALIVAVHTFEKQFLSVEPKLFVPRLNLPHTEADLPAIHLNRSHIRLLGTPQFEVLESFAELSASFNLDLNQPCPVVERADKDLRLFLDNPHSSVEPAEEIEVVERSGEFHLFLVEAVVEGGDNLVLSLAELPDRNFKFRVWIRVFPKLTSVNCEPSAQSHAFDLQHGILEVLFDRESPAIEGRSALEVVVWHHVPASRDAHFVVGGEAEVIDLFERLILFKSEVPDSSEGNGGEESEKKFHKILMVMELYMRKSGRTIFSHRKYCPSRRRRLRRYCTSTACTSQRDC